jgi:hypothetical protein
VPGELYIGGEQLARGYLGRPALTADRFVPDPYGEAGSRLYRTGDRARWLADGTLEYLGRLDEQVKVRGFRIEPGEIESVLRSHPAVAECAVVARTTGPGDTRLVAYVVGDADADALRAHVRRSLPDYMVPSVFVPMDALPLTDNGKLDRKALPAPRRDAFATLAYEAPRGEVEEALAQIWAEVLEVERVGRHDHFFDLGGHSLLVLRVIARVRTRLGLEVAPSEFFTAPVLAELARSVAATPGAELPEIRPVKRTGAIPLSFAQERLWLLGQAAGAQRAHRLSRWVRLGGALDGAALRRALERIVARHEALRTTFPRVGGGPVQRIAAVRDAGFLLIEHDLRGSPVSEAGLRRLAAEEAGSPFDVAHGPLVRGHLARVGDEEHALLVAMHPIVADGESMEVFVRELGALYDAFRRGEEDPLPPLAIQYADYAAWQRRWITGEVLREHAGRWRRTLAGIPESLALPTDHPRTARRDFAGGWVPFALDAELTAGLKALGARHGAPLHVTLLAAWAALLSRLSGQHDVVVGTPVANRGRAGTEGLIGAFAHLLPVRVSLSGAPSGAELLGRVMERVLGARELQEVPFERVMEPAAVPFQTMVALESGPETALGLPGHDGSGLDLSLRVRDLDAGVAGGVEYARDLFQQETVERWVGHLKVLLRGMVDGETVPVERLPLLSTAERAQVVHSFNARETRAPQAGRTHEVFEALAARTPDAVAVQYEGRSFTYGELNTRANHLATHLLGLGVGPGVRVALCLARKPEMVVGFLSVHKAGGIHVPLNPGDPEERRRGILRDSKAAVVLTHAPFGPLLHGAGTVPVLDLAATPVTWEAAHHVAEPAPDYATPAVEHG